jgi:aminoglycoside phosphotransferase (APT) family kinase protein
MNQAIHLKSEPRALLHRDLHLKNFLVHGDQVALIDLDELSLGDPWHDLGSLVAALHMRSLMGGAASGIIQNAADHFCRSYAESTAWPFDPAAVNWHTAVALVVERAFRIVTRLQPGSVDLLDALLAHAEELTS